MSYFQDDENEDKYSDASDEDSSSESSEEENINEEDAEIDENAEEIEDDDDDDMEGGGAEDVDSDSEFDDFDEDEEEVKEKLSNKKSKKITDKKSLANKIVADDDDEDDEDEDEYGEQYLQKFDRSINENYVVNFHPESILQNYDEILSMTKVVRDKDGIIVDKLHRTIPFLTKYEKARIIGQRATQLNAGATPFVKVPESVIDGIIIAEMELKEKKIPFIIRRPLPNGGSEYWSLKDLEYIAF